MADVRALLRQQRAARRIEHPHASYSDTGKLTCAVCHEYVKTESLWDGHLRSAGHRQRLQALHEASAKNSANGYAGFVADSGKQSALSNKRKLVESDEEMADQDDDTAPRKRAKADIPPAEQVAETPAKKEDGAQSKPITPPLNRRTSGTPTLGVEMQIPSRPATPNSGGTPMATTPKAAPIGRSPLIPDEPILSQPHPPVTSAPAIQLAAPAPASVDEDEWAAFEADLVHEKSITKPTGSSSSARQRREEERAKRRALVDIQLEDEKEDATRALETEFEIMEDLEARARRLRERREALRLQSNGGGASSGAADAGGKADTAGKENAAVPEDEDDEDDDEEDDWDGFRFRA
ncbi:hypothetical protein N0V88_007245 [Collariella sp. IMI 366227]|nr:hypothetical protein N0V88_007245 [Collariella sp. IMI 366227]